ncbi:acid phosphatase [Pholiota conissans]|uniref:Acid phosphatase n=1 Tax=Pholiota conissans TaxID=109636 RepID=A0A9P6CXM1_9AGAR|nr:acid phosphatase [Pholiota conissans]
MLLSSLICATLIFGAESRFIEPKPKPSRNPVVPGVVFDRFITIWLENINFASASSDPNFAALTKQGIQLTNYFAVTHPSEPNYVASVGGDYFGMNNDNLHRIPANISSIVDLLEEKGISWGEYQEDMPETGFQGFQQLAPSGANDYVRKHNPLIIFDSVANFSSRADKIKNFTLFEQDLAENKIPQWSFITPNMTNDGHDTNITFASTWARGFLEPLLKNPHFNGEKTLILLTFDENGSSDPHNRVDSVLLGTAVPRELIGTQDTAFYTHYSEIATVEANWGLHTLGRFDVGANVFSLVAKHTRDVIRKLDVNQAFLNISYPGPFNTAPSGNYAVPNTKLTVNGRRVLPKVVETWGSAHLQRCALYDGALLPPSGLNPPVIPEGC